MKTKLIYTFLFLSLAFCAFSQTLEEQINQATMALLEEDRAFATVYTFNEEGEISLARKGTSKNICLGDDPTKKGFSVACYHQDLEPFMIRGRQLQAEKKSFQEIFDIRESEAKKGKLKMPKAASTLHLLSGETLETANYRYVVYIPWATAESSGLPLKPIVAGAPWIMDPGTHRAHIMITPPAKKQ